MTEQQIEHLKNILSSSTERQNSPELDERILSAARARACAPEEKRSFLSMVLVPFRFMPAAALAITLTVAVFFGMGQLVKVDQPVHKATSKSVDLPFSETADESIASKSKESTLATDSLAGLASKSLISQPDTEQARDQILTEVKLPDTQTLLSAMEFSLSRDRVLAERSIAMALDDIHIMISEGQLNNARERYARLRQLCDVCTLPDTLEGLILTAPADRQPDSDSS